MPMDRQFSRIDWGAIGESFRQSYHQSFRHTGATSLGGENLRHIPAPPKSEWKPRGDAHAHDHNEDSSTPETERSSRPKCLLCTLLLVVVGAIAVVCFVTIPPDTAISYWKAMSGSGSSNKKQAMIDVVAQQQQGQEQQMLELAEQITSTCGKSSPSPLRRRISSDSTATAGTGTPSCQKLCQNHMCCVILDEEYSCKNDEKKSCAVYAGCEALIKDNLW